jgi:hypothetical protein
MVPSPSTASQKERDWLHWLKQAETKQITQAKAIERMKVSERWVRKLLQRKKRKGGRVVVHGLRGGQSNRRLPEWSLMFRLFGLLVKTRNFPEPSIGIEVVLNPELSAGLLQKRFHRRAGRGRLISIELSGRNQIQPPLFRVVVQITAPLVVRKSKITFREFLLRCLGDASQPARKPSHKQHMIPRPSGSWSRRTAFPLTAARRTVGRFCRWQFAPATRQTSCLMLAQQNTLNPEP